MSGVSTTAGSTGREELDECQDSGVSTTAGSTGREELDDCQE
jgi:hypothetical protein